jgi:hypothetical protein
MELEIKNFPNYRISPDGSIWSNYKFKTAIACDEWRPVQHVLDKCVGYFLVTLVNNECRKNQFIHRLLAQHFIPNPLNKPQVNHIDGNKQNNALSNLEWVTAAENSQHAVRIGLCDARTTAQSVPIRQLTLDGTLVAEHVSLHEAGRTTGVAWQNISKVVRGIRPKAGGFMWEYK